MAATGLVDWETGNWKMPRDAAGVPIAWTARAMVDETLSWLVAADRLAKENGVPLVVVA